jgi:hypothetical protein
MRIPRLPFQLKNVVLLLFCLALAILGWWNYGTTGKGQYLLEALLGSAVLILCLFVAIYPLLRKSSLMKK